VKVFEPPCFHAQRVYSHRGICVKTKVITTWDCEKPPGICSNNYASVPLSCECKVPKCLLRKQN